MVGDYLITVKLVDEIGFSRTYFLNLSVIKVFNEINVELIEKRLGEI